MGDDGKASVVVVEEGEREGSEERKGRVDLAAAYRMCEFYGFNEGVCNHLSYMVDKETFLVNDYGMAWEEVGSIACALSLSLSLSLFWAMWTWK